jgi:thiamine pyrophosphate-dependent acetolactate synthase large subunit-like protein
MAGRASVPSDHRNALYPYSTAADAARREADVIIACGSRIGNLDMEEPNERRLFGRTFGTAMGPVHWDRVGEGLGCEGFVVDRLEDFEGTLSRARESSRPAVICLQTDRDANLAIPGDLMMRFAEVYQGPMGQ